MEKEGLSSKVFSVCGTTSVNQAKLASYWKGLAPLGRVNAPVKLQPDCEKPGDATR